MNQEERALRLRLETGDFDKNFLVEAGAGAGKSHTICQRILHQLQGGRDPEGVVVITFTRKATQELKGKLARQALNFGPELAARVEQIHISTIHSFCRRVLELFPLESGCGLDLQRAEAAEEKKRARALFRRWTQEDPEGRFARFEALGGRRGQLWDTFWSAAWDGVVPTGTPVSDPDFQARSRRLEELLHQIHARLRAALIPGCQDQLWALPDGLARAVEAPSPGPEELLELKRALVWAWSSQGLDLEKLLFTAHPGVKAALEGYLDGAEKGPALFPALENAGTALTAQAAELSRLDRSLGYDLAMAALAPAVEDYLEGRREQGLCTDDDLLRRARDLVRNVPQARALLRRRFQVFYVDEFQDTDPVQAEFLVLLTHARPDGERDWTRCVPAPGSLFLVGDPKQAIYRFRGADLEIYKRVRGMFEAGAGEVVQLRTNFRSNAGICAFADLAFDPARSNKRAPSSGDCLDDGPCQAAYTAMEAEQGDHGLPAVAPYTTSQENDPLLLAQTIRAAVEKGLRLPDRNGTPVPLKYGDFLILTNRRSAGAPYVEELSRLGIPVSFAGAQPLSAVPQTARMAAWLDWLLDENSEAKLIQVLCRCYGLQDLEPLRRLRRQTGRRLTQLVRSREGIPDAEGGAELAGLWSILAELARVREKKNALPPMAFLEWLGEELTGLTLPGDSDRPEDRRRQYSCMRQYLQKVSQCPRGGFAQLARFALEQAEGSLEGELPLSPAEDCVRVMNLHKAKGLEAKVVILACDTAISFSLEKQGSRRPVFQKGFRTAPVYAPEDWEAVKDREKEHNSAEKVRLRYVAVTRAEQLLLIAKGSRCAWNALADRLIPAKERKKAFPLDLGPLCLPPAEDFVPPAAAETTPPLRDLTGRRAELTDRLSRAERLHISPSALDKGRRPRLEERPEPPEGGEGPAPSAGPKGADWGTMVHRVMELYVSRRPGPEGAAALIRQAVEELPASLSRRQRELLFGGEEPEDRAAYLTRRLWESTRFWFEPEHPLRRLTEGAVCRCELPFQILLSGPDQPDWQLIARGLSCGEDFRGAISVSGILDLAVCREGVWHIVDYKTDALRPGESLSAYRARLAGEYTAQLSAYARILARLTGQRAADGQLCAIPLCGELLPVCLE